MNSPQYRALHKIRHELFAEAVARAPEEACGLLGWRPRRMGGRMTLYACENASQSPVDSFLIPPLRQLDVLETMGHLGEEFWGVFHSHPSQGAKPSQRDRAFAHELGGNLRWVIVGLEPDDGRPEIWAGKL